MSTPSMVMRPPSHVVEAEKQVDDRRLAGAGGAHQRHALPGLDAEGDVLQDRLTGHVGERHVLECDHTAVVVSAFRRTCGVRSG